MGEPKYIKPLIMHLKERIENNTMITWQYYILLTSIDKSSKQKTVPLIDTLEQKDLNIYSEHSILK